MSRSSHQRQQQKLQLQQQQQQQLLVQQQQQIADNEAAAAAAEMFDLFCVATTMRQVLGLHRNMCDVVGMRPAPLNEFYPKLKAKVRSWKAQALWKKFDARAVHRAYAKGSACTGTRVLVIGAGPCGLRTAIEAQLLGAKVVVVEKRDRISRNNVLHLWPFVITDLRNLGAKKFYGKFCAGSIDHISIRQLQCILLKVALLLGVEIHEGVSFDSTIEPSGDGCGWRAAITPSDHAVSHYEFDVLIGADGKRNTLEGFRRKEFRGKLAIAITANFINKKTEAEAKAEEISGVAFIFNQSFFKELYHTTGIDLENIVYYKDETHYFVMTAKKHSLIDKGVIMQDYADPAELLAPANVNTEKLLDYAREAAEFSTKYQMPNLEFAVNHYGKPDVAMFDFTSMFAAETSCRVLVRKGFRLLQCLVGDSLLEPFWPTGSGCARGFLSSMDAAYAIKLWSNAANSTLGVLAQRESIYRLLNQTTPENLQRDTGSYTVDPATRYPNLNRTSVNVWQVKHLVDTDDKSILEQTFMDTNALQATQVDTPVRRKRRSADTMPLSTVLLRWICAQLHSYEFTKNLKEVSDVFSNGKVLCALINRYRPDLVDFSSVKDLSPIECNELAFKILDKELHIPRIMSGKDSLQLNAVESKVWLNYLEQICEVFRGEIPHVKHPKMDFTDLREKYRINYTHAQPDFSKLLQITTKQKAGKSPVEDMVDVPQVVQRRSVLDEEKTKRQRKYDHLASGAAVAAVGGAAGSGTQAHTDTPRRAKKRRSAEKTANIEERQKRLQEIEQNRLERMSKRRQQRYQQTQNFYKSLHMLQANTLLRESDESSAFEDYSIFMYRQQAPVFNDRVKELERKLLYPDRDRGDIPSALPRGNTDEQFSDRIKSMEQRISTRQHHGTDKKPKDLMRAIGKIDSTDWNVREIEKKIEQSKRTEIHGPKGREKVPKWSKEQFMARQNKMSKPTRQDSGEEKFKEIDQTLKNLDKQLKEGSVLEVGERGRNKVASIAGQFVKKDDTSEEKNPPTVVPKSNSKVALAFKKQAASEKCHFCKQTVYLMEKIQTEGLVLHRSCLKCHHCHTNLRLGGYAFDRDDPSGRFYCTQHFRLPAKPTRPVARKPGQRKPTQQQQAAAAAVATTVDAGISTTSGTVDELRTPDNKLRGHADNVAQLDLLDRGQTPERIEFENTDAMSDGEPSEEHIIDEHEWSGRNFLPESNNDTESELTSSDESDSESDSDMFEEANDSPLGVQTLQLATDWIGKQNYSESDDSDDFYDSSEGIADDGKDDTEGEEFKKARELRREEVRLLPLPANLPTDTETELKKMNENKENIATDPVNNGDTQGNVISNSNSNQNLKQDADRQSLKSFTSEKSFRSAASSAPSIPPTRIEIEKLDQNSDRKFSADIEAISEKLYRLNNMVKMNKDLETLTKENLVQSDILKKLTLKEKWLADNNVGSLSPLAPKSKFELKSEMGQPDLIETAEKQLPKDNGETAYPASTNGRVVTLINEQPTVEAFVPKSPNFERKTTNLNRTSSLKKSSNKLSQNASPQVDRKQSTNVSRSSSFKSNASSSPKSAPKSANVSRMNSMKKPKISNSKEAITDDNNMQIEDILDIVKKMDITNFETSSAQLGTSIDETNIMSQSEKDIGKLIYDVENKFSPKPNKRMTAKLKEIESRNFAGTMDNIKAQIVMPTVSAQADPSVDLSKYFPNQKQDKSVTGTINKNQKTLKDVDLTKYFPTSPVPQRRSSVVTVADKLKKSQTEKSLAPTAAATTSGNVPSVKGTLTTVNPNKVAPKRQSSLGSAAFSLRDHQLDGAADISKKRMPATVVTTTATASATKKGNVKIIKKIVPKGTKAKKIAEVASTAAAANTNKTSIMPRDESDRILDEILREDEKAARSPSLEYQKLFKEEKSPSEDISDKIELILEETGIDLGIPTLSDKRKKLLKAKSLGEGDFKRNPNKLSEIDAKSKECGDSPTGVQNILKRFESMSSVKSDEQAFKLRRMESTTGNLNKSRESIVSHDSFISRESDSISDLEKTMEYLKSEWRNEATNFLQKKRDHFFAQKGTTEEEAATKIEEMTKSQYEDLPVEYRESKLAKFFGIKQKSPEKRKSPAKKKSPGRKVSATQNSVSPAKIEKPKSAVLLKKTNNSMEQFTHISNSRQADKKVLKASDIIAKFERNSSITNSVNEIDKLSRNNSLETPSVINANWPETKLKENISIAKPTDAMEQCSRKNSVASSVNNANLPKAKLEENVSITNSAGAIEQLSRNNSLETFSVINANQTPNAKLQENSIANSADAIEQLSRKNSAASSVNNDNFAKAKLEENISIENSADAIEQLSRNNSLETFSVINANQTPNAKLQENSIANSADAIEQLSRKNSAASSVNNDNFAKAKLEENISIENSADAIEQLSRKNSLETFAVINANSPNAKLAENISIASSANEIEPISIYNSFETSSVMNANLPLLDKSSLISPSVAKVEDIQNELLNTDKDMVQISPVISRQNSNNADTELPQQIELINTAQKKRPLVEDIKNLPKTGCDKSLNSSRRGSQASLQSRRLSDGSLTEQLEYAATELAKSSLSKSQEHIDELFANLVDEIADLQKAEVQYEASEDECDSLNTSISKSPSLAPTTVRIRGSSEDESIEKLFSKFSDEMLVNVEFDSNDELVAITPRANLINNGNYNMGETIDPEKDYIGKLESLERDEIITDQIEENDRNGKVEKEFEVSDTYALNSLHDLQTQFPTRPQRRQKSTSSSSETSAPVAPQRFKKKLATLCPESMPPSVQDMLYDVLSKSINAEQMHVVRVADPIPLKFPMKIDEDDLFVDEIESDIKKSELGNDFSSTEKTEALTDNKVNGIVSSPQLQRKAFRTSCKSDSQAKCSANKSPTSTHRGLPESPERKMDITVKSALIPSRQSSKSSVKSVDSTDQIKPTQLTCNIPEFQSSNSEHLPRRQSNMSGTESPKTNTPTKAQSKEKSLEWDMEKIAASPMPRRKFVHAERAGIAEAKIKELSPAGSLKSRNSLKTVESDSDVFQRHMIEEFERERRKDLIQRDKIYQDIQTTELFAQKDNTMKRSAPHPTPQKQLSSESSSRRSKRITLLPVNKDGTPPMLKKLEIPTEIKRSPESSRRSSFAFIELLENNHPIIAPMPKKLELPKIVTKLVPDNNSSEKRTDGFKNKRKTLENEATLKSDDHEDNNSTGAIPEPTSTVPVVFKNRRWPDGKTDFSKEDSPDSLERDDIATFLSKRRHEHHIPKPQSQSPQLEHKHHIINGTNNKTVSKSVSDLRKNTPPFNSTHNSTQSLYIAPQSSHSSVYNEPHSYLSAYSIEQLPQRPARNSKAAGPVDASTRMLLDRSKRLHNRKRDFINERVAERNPYMKDLIDEEQLQSVALEAEVEDELESYRPRNYTRSRTRFPTSRTYGGNGLSQNYDYVSASALPYPDYSASSSRRQYTSALPSATTSTADYYSYPSSTAANTNTYGTTARGSHFMDYFKRSPSHHRERELSKESCVQSESETTSPDEVELNSATEISTDSEFDHDEIIRETPKIFIDDTHLRKPTKVQVKSSVITTSTGQKYTAQTKGSYLQKYQVNPPQPQFKPLVQVDPLLLSTNRKPLQNPRPGDYLLNKTASTEGIASKKSLELKKRYLLGEPANGNKIQKSGSTSVLDSKIRSFQSNISECQKLLNPGNDISPSMKTFLDRTKLGENANDLMRSATTNILNDLKVQITIQKASSAVSTDNEKENMFVNSKNELNKGMEYSETVNTTLLESISKKSPPTPTNNQQTIIETIDLVTPEKKAPIIDLTKVEIPTKMLESNVEFINKMAVEHEDTKSSVSPDNCTQFLTTDSNKIIDLTCDSPVKSDKTIIEDIKPDVSKDVQEQPDILKHIAAAFQPEKKSKVISPSAEEEQQQLLSNSGDEEKRDSPEKLEEQYENDTVQIQVPNIPWKPRRVENLSSTTGSSCSSHSSSVEDIQHYILESTTSPDTQTAGLLGGTHQVPRVEIHDTSGTLMQIDSLMIIDGKYIGDPEDLKYMEIPEGVIIPELSTAKTSEVEDETDVDVEPSTATPEPAERRVVEAEEQPPPLPEQGPPLPERGPPRMKPADLKFDTKNENKIESLKNLPLIVEQTVEHTIAIKPITLNLSSSSRKSPATPTTPTAALKSPISPLVDNDKTPTADLLSRGSDSETELTGTGQALTETELSDWTADDCISENFVDMEFVLNSNKGTIKRNKKGKKKLNSPKLPSTSEIMCQVAKVAPVAEFEDILQNIDIDDIEFMDTGSEGSCAEAYSATNTAMLRNRGYIEFIETTPKHTPSHIIATSAADCVRSTDAAKYKPAATKRDEKLGIDYIEQGAYIMQHEINIHDALKTPVNEAPKAVADTDEYMDAADKTQTVSAMTQSLTDSSTLNDLDEDSLCMVTPNSQGLISTTATATSTKTTTEESDALTIVTSPLDTSSPKTQDVCQAAATNMPGKSSETAAGSTPSSSEKNPKTSQSTCAPSSTSTTSSSKDTPPRQLSQELSATPVAPAMNENAIAPRKPSEELSYEEYVRALQQKITQISTARDSLETRKQRRKSSKGETPAVPLVSNNVQTVIERTPSKPQLVADVDALPATPSTGTAPPTHKVPEIPTLTRRLEEITKERTKQKDLIHDLVMDKLQSKKQLNAEKRLHRSRQRSMLPSGYNSGSSLSPTPKIAAAATTTDNNCTNRAHYHVSTAAPIADVERSYSQRNAATASNSIFKENNPLQKSATTSYVSAYGLKSVPPTRVTTTANTQRPFSEHLDSEQLDALEHYKLSKTPSFSYAKRNLGDQQAVGDNNLASSAVYAFVTPKTIQQQRAVTPAASDKSISASMENLRSEARARARLKSNSELGLSPEEKMQLLRKRLYAEQQNGKCDYGSSAAAHVIEPQKQQQREARSRKMSSSKSVNDLAYMSSQQADASAADVSNMTANAAKVADFTSDPNLLLSSTSIQDSVKSLKSKSSRRQKEPERRKSLIQSLSSFFHKSSSSMGQHNNSNGKDKKEQTSAATASASCSAQTERTGTSGSNTITASGSAEGMFSRFRISPKSKEKSKDKDGYAQIASSAAALTTPTTPTRTTRPHERSNSQDCIYKLHTMSTSNLSSHLNNSSHLRHHHNTNNNKHHKKSSACSSTSATAFSSSSPQLYVHKPYFTSNTAAAAITAIDEQIPPPIPPLPLNYQRSDDESYATETREQKKQRAISKAVRQAELKRLRIAQEIQREQEEIEVQLKELEARGVLVEKALRGEGQNVDNLDAAFNIGSSDEKLLKELLEIWRNITQLKKRDEELSIRQQELQLEHRHAQLKEELNLRLSCNKLDKSSADVAAEGAILNEMLEIVAKRAALRPTSGGDADLAATEATTSTAAAAVALTISPANDSITLTTNNSIATARGQSFDNDESHI